MTHVDVVGHRPFADFDGLGDVAVPDIDLLLEPLERRGPSDRSAPGRLSGAAGRREHGQLVEPPVHPLRERLDHQHVGVAIDDQRWQPIGFAVHEAVRRGVDVQRLAERNRRREALAPSVLADGLLAGRHHAQRDLRPIAPHRFAKLPLPRADHGHEIAGGGARPRDVAAIDPRDGRGAGDLRRDARRERSDSSTSVIRARSVDRARPHGSTRAVVRRQSRRHVHDRLDPCPAQATSTPRSQRRSPTNGRARSSGLELIASENFVSQRDPRGHRIGLHEQVRRRVSGQALLRRLRIRGRGRDAGNRARESAVRRRARQRAAALGRAGEHGRVHGRAQARRDHPGHEPRARRPPHARPPAELLGQVLQRRAVRRPQGRRAPRLRRARLARPRAQARSSSSSAPAPIRACSTSRASGPWPTRSAR